MSLALVFETHSTTEDNEIGLMTGWLPGRLSALGREQARALGERRAGARTIFASDLGRAVETAAIAFPGRDVRLDWRLRECDYGELNGAPKQDLPFDQPYPGGESRRSSVARVIRFLDELAPSDVDSPVLVIGHMSTYCAVVARCTGRAPEDVWAEPYVWQAGWELELS